MVFPRRVALCSQVLPTCLSSTRNVWCSVPPCPPAHHSWSLQSSSKSISVSTPTGSLHPISPSEHTHHLILRVSDIIFGYSAFLCNLGSLLAAPASSVWALFVRRLRKSPSVRRSLQPPVVSSVLLTTARRPHNRCACGVCVGCVFVVCVCVVCVCGVCLWCEAQSMSHCGGP